MSVDCCVWSMLEGYDRKAIDRAISIIIPQQYFMASM
jgi:hypothetical protein